MQAKSHNKEQVRDFLNTWLDSGDKKLAAKQFGVTPQTISRIVSGANRNMEILKWLVARAKENQNALEDLT